MADDRTTGRPDPGGDYTERDSGDYIDRNTGDYTEREAGSPGSRSVRLPGTVAPGAEGLTADDRTPGPPGPGTDARMPDDGLGAPSPGRSAARESGTTEPRSGDTWPTAPGAPGTHSAPGTDGSAGTGVAGAPLLAHDETDQWEQRLRHAVTEFVDEPRAAVEEADRALEEIAARFTDAVTRRRRTLRNSWQDTEKRGPGSDADTEQLRLALRDYRELAGRLLHN
ncbi:hypothetical protein [Streptomyces sp. NPDC047028]|uniref:hypothetical protein n=1 Tax=Streptomyces sp. NPDC047028 TaxID=3155793 RepID=UPI0033F4BDBF